MNTENTPSTSMMVDYMLFISDGLDIFRGEYKTSIYDLQEKSQADQIFFTYPCPF